MILPTLGLIVFTLGSLSAGKGIQAGLITKQFAAEDNFYLLITGRAIQGMGEIGISGISG